MKRLEYVDIFRGVAILIMIFIEIFDFLSRKNIYTDAPWYVSQINSITWVPPVWLFTMVVGMSVFLLIEKAENMQRWKSVWLAAKRYLPYVLISLPFTIVMWGLPTYVGWNEALQGIGLTAVFAAIIFSFRLKTKHLLALVIGFALLHTGLNSINFGISSIVINALWKGWFSVSNLLPFMLAGAVCLQFLREGKLRKLLLLGFAFTMISLILNFAGFRIDFYGRSFASFFFGIGESALIMSAVFWIWQRTKMRAWNVIGNFGKAAIVAYLGHYLLIGLPSRKLGIVLPDIWVLVLTPVLIAGIYLLCLFYLRLKLKIKSRKLTTG